MGIVLEMWLTSGDDRTCKRCASLDRRRYQEGHGPQPPLHPRCRCIRRFAVTIDPDAMTTAERLSLGSELARNQAAADRASSLPTGSDARLAAAALTVIASGLAITADANRPRPETTRRPKQHRRPDPRAP